jgi:hypothetical protein
MMLLCDTDQSLQGSEAEMRPAVRPELMRSARDTPAPRAAAPSPAARFVFDPHPGLALSLMPGKRIASGISAPIGKRDSKPLFALGQAEVIKPR